MVEDRIIGPLTLKQFLFLLGAGSVVLIGWFFLPFFLFLVIAVPVGSLFIAMAFAKINGQAFPTVFANAINYYLKPHLYLWQPGKGGGAESGKRIADSVKVGRRSEPQSPLAEIPKLSAGKLSDLAWSLDIKERISR